MPTTYDLKRAVEQIRAKHEPRPAPSSPRRSKRDTYPLPAPMIDRDVLIPGVDLLCGLPNPRRNTTVPEPTPWPTYSPNGATSDSEGRSPGIQSATSTAPAFIPHPCYTERQGPRKLGLPKLDRRVWTDLVEGLFIGSFQNHAILLYPDGKAFAIPAHRVVWSRQLDSDILFEEFIDGYRNGWESAWDGMPLGNKTQNRIPTDSGRGFAKGYSDFINHIGCRNQRFEPYNETVRQLQAMFPEDHGYIPEPVTYKFEIIGYGSPNRQGPPLQLAPGQYPQVRLLSSPDAPATSPERATYVSEGRSPGNQRPAPSPSPNGATSTDLSNAPTL